MKLSHTTRVRTSGYGEYAYVYNTATGYRSLADGVAPDILEQLQGGATLHELADAIMRTYNVDDRTMVLTDCTLSSQSFSRAAASRRSSRNLCGCSRRPLRRRMPQ